VGEIISSGLTGWLEKSRKIYRLFRREWLVIFCFSFMKDDRSSILDSNGVNCFESVF